MKISILTLFPDMFSGPFSSSIVKRAQEKHAVTIEYVNIREFATDKYKSVDDHPYGGGVGMILRVDIIDRALQKVKGHTILLDPQGTPYTQKKARELSKLKHIVLICGHYEGVDERVRSLIDEEISVGDYILSGGEIPAMVIVDSVVRLLVGVLQKTGATDAESFEAGMLEYSQYTRPQTYKKNSVPTVLLSGNHAQIALWREKQARAKTQERRPDLLTAKRGSP